MMNYILVKIIEIGRLEHIAPVHPNCSDMTFCSKKPPKEHLKTSNLIYYTSVCKPKNLPQKSSNSESLFSPLQIWERIFNRFTNCHILDGVMKGIKWRGWRADIKDILKLVSTCVAALLLADNSAEDVLNVLGFRWVLHGKL